MAARTFAEVLDRERDTLMDALAHQQVPFDELPVPRGNIGQDDAAAFARLAPSARFVNFHRTTETPQVGAWHPVSRAELDDPGTPAIVPLGRAIADTRLLVLDGKRHCGIGEPGRPASAPPTWPSATWATTSRPSALPPRTRRVGPAQRVYRTGDLGRYRRRPLAVW